MSVVVHSNVLLGAAAAIALISFGLSSWFYANSEELKHLHKRIDRLVRSLGKGVRGVRVAQSSRNDQPSSPPLPSWVFDLHGDVESLKSKNRYLEEELAILRNHVLLERPAASLVPSQTPPRPTFSIPATPPLFNLPPPLPPIPTHLSRDEWVKAAEELVWCTDEERVDKKAEIEEAMANMPSVVAIIQELFVKSAGARETSEKQALTQEYGDKLYNMLVVIYGDMAGGIS